MRAKIIAFIKLSRAYFLLMSVLPYGIGIGIARQEVDRLDNRLLWMGLAAQLLIQLSVSYLNDYWDIETDRINTRRTLLSGGSGELITGVLPPVVALVAGNGLQVLAFILAMLANISSTSWLVLVLSITITQVYTAPPIKLVYRGLGEITTAILAAFIVPSWAYSLQIGELNGEIFWLGLPLIPFVTAMMLGIATPDIEADRQVDKITLAVLAGEANLARVYLGIVLLGYLLALLILPVMLPVFVLIGVGLSIPLAGWAWAGLRNPIKATNFEWLFMVVRTGLVALVMILTINAGVWFG